MKFTLVVFALFYASISFGAPQSKGASKAKLYSLMSDFDILLESPDQFTFDVINVIGDRVNEFPRVKEEEYQNFVKYSFHNPFVKANPESLHLFDLFIFKQVRPFFVDSRESSSLEDLVSHLQFDIYILVERATQKTIKSRARVFLDNKIIADGEIEENSVLKLNEAKQSDRAQLTIKSFRVKKSLMNSHKRAFDLSLQALQYNKPIEQVMRLSLTNILKIPLAQLNDAKNDSEGNDSEIEIEEPQEEVEKL